MSSISNEYKRRQQIEEERQTGLAASQEREAMATRRKLRIGGLATLGVAMLVGTSLIFRAIAGTGDTSSAYVLRHMNLEIIEATDVIDAFMAFEDGSESPGGRDYQLEGTSHTIDATYIRQVATQEADAAEPESEDASVTEETGLGTSDTPEEPDEFGYQVRQPSENEDAQIGATELTDETTIETASEQEATNEVDPIDMSDNAQDASNDSETIREATASEGTPTVDSITQGLETVKNPEGAMDVPSVPNAPDDVQDDDENDYSATFADGDIANNENAPFAEESTSNESEPESETTVADDIDTHAMSVIAEVTLMDPKAESLYYVALIDRLRAFDMGCVTEASFFKGNMNLEYGPNLMYDERAGILYVAKDSDLVTDDGARISVVASIETDASDEEVIKALQHPDDIKVTISSQKDDEVTSAQNEDEPASAIEDEDELTSNEQIAPDVSISEPDYSELGARRFEAPMEDMGLAGDELLDEYIHLQAREIKGNESPIAADDYLSGSTEAFYDAVLPQVADIAAGRRRDATLAVPFSAVASDYDGPWTASDLGVERLFDDDGQLTDEAIDAAYERIGDIDFESVLNALQMDYAPMLYWYDQGSDCVGTSLSYFSMFKDEQWMIGFDASKDASLSIPVAKEFADGGISNGTFMDKGLSSTIYSALNEQLASADNNIVLSEND